MTAETADGFDRWRARASLLLGPALFAALLLLPLPLKPEAQRLAAVMALVVAFWIGEPIPVAATALLAPCLALLVGAVPGADVRTRVAAAFSKFGDPILMLFIGGLFLAQAMAAHGLDRRIALGILSRKSVGASGARMVAALGVCSCLLSMWMNNTAVTALMIPIAAGMLGVARRGRPSGALGEAAMLMIPFAATVGGLATPVGTAPNLIGLGQLRTLAGVEVGFLQWMLLALPLAAALMAALILLLGRGLPVHAEALAAEAASERGRLGPWSRGEKLTLAAFLMAVGLWILGGLAQAWKGCAPLQWLSGRIPEESVPLLAAGLLFLLPASKGRPVLTWAQASRIDWGTLLLLGGGLSLGDLMLKTGLAAALGDAAVQGLGISSLWGLTALAAALAIGLSELTSNTATASMLLPVVIALAKAAGVSVIPPALAATLGCSFGFMLPISTPPNALAYATGMVPLRVMARRGLVFDAIGFVVLTGGLRLLCPALGLV